MKPPMVRDIELIPPTSNEYINTIKTHKITIDSTIDITKLVPGGEFSNISIRFVWYVIDILGNRKVNHYSS